MIRPFTREQALENAAFLRLLRRTGNAREAARALGAHRARFTKRRAKHPAFAADWDAALAIAAARLNGRSPATKTDEPRVVATRDGRLQLRAPAGRRLTREHEQMFLAALSATANVRLAARAAGFSHSAFYARRRASPAFAREMRRALETGCERVECALIESFHPAAALDDAWRRNDLPAIPSMTAAEAIQLLRLHDKSARFAAERPDLRPRRGEPTEVWRNRVAAIRAVDSAREQEEALAATIERLDDLARRVSPHEPPAPALPSLDQVTGWSNADPTLPRGTGATAFTRNQFGS